MDAKNFKSLINVKLTIQLMFSRLNSDLNFEIRMSEASGCRNHRRRQRTRDADAGKELGNVGSHPKEMRKHCLNHQEMRKNGLNFKSNGVGKGTQTKFS